MTLISDIHIREFYCNERLTQTLIKKGEPDMKNRKSHKYKNYGPIPQNEYNSTNTGKNTNPEDVLEYNPQTDDTTDDAIDEQLSLKQRVRHQSGRVRSRGWMRSGKANGWRAESASQQDKLIDVRRSFNYVRENKRVYN